MEKSRKITEDIEKTLSLTDRKDFIEFNDDFYTDLSKKIPQTGRRKRKYSTSMYSRLVVLLPLLILLNIFIFYLIFNRNTEYKQTRERVLIDSLSTDFYYIE